ncbi:MAG: hypothetical protein HON99_02070 [Crocinitomicaceae bacterium]|jgi:hypothetical protein|nr:hypothetical protein [Crocinitomicaceae bacterium]
MKYFLSLCLLGGTIFSLAQDLSNHVPTLSKSVFVIDAASIHEKCQKANLETFEFFKELKENTDKYLTGSGVDNALVPMLVANSHDFGISTSDFSYLFTRDRDSINYTAFIFKISNEEKVNNLIKTMVLDEEGIELGIGEGFEFAYNDKMIIGWNSRMVAFFDYRIPYNYGTWEAVEETTTEDYYENYEDRYEALEKEEKEKKASSILVALEEIFNPNPKHTISENAHFKEVVNKSADIIFFVDGFGNMNVMNDVFGTRGTVDGMLSIFADNYFYCHINMNDNDITAAYTYHVSDVFKDMMMAANKGKFNKNLFKYIDGQNLIGYLGMAVDSEAYYEMVMDMYSKVMSSMPRYGEVVSSGMDIYNILLDEDEVFDFIKGDALFAVTNIKQFDVTYTSYEYDDDFNEHEITKTKQELLPEYVFLASIGNEKLRGKIIELLEKSELLIQKEGYYLVLDPYNSYRKDKENGMLHYVAIENDVLIVTNDVELVSTYRESGLPKNRLMSKERRSHLKKNNYVGYWDSGNTFSKMTDEMKGMGQDFFSIMEEANAVIENATINGLSSEGNLFSADLKLKMKGEEKLAITHLLELAESIYKMQVK